MSARAREDFIYRFRMVRFALRDAWEKKMVRIGLGMWLFRNMPRPCYCACCKCYGWCTSEMAAYSTARGFLCEDCAEDNEKETANAWASFYGRG